MSADQENLCHTMTQGNYWHLSDIHKLSNGVLCQCRHSCMYLKT